MIRALRAALATAAIVVLAACARPATSIGRPGTGDGEFRAPRGIAVSDRGIAVLDRTGRMQLFDLDGTWRRSIEVVPGDVRRGLPTGVCWLPDGTLLVAHSHQSRLVVFDAVTGSAVRTIGDYGVAPGSFLYPQRVTLDAAGDYVVSEFGFDTTNRVQVLRPDGTSLRVLGGGRDAEGGLGRPMGALPLADGTTLVADERAGVVRFTADGRSLGAFGPPPGPSGFFRGICGGDDGDVYVLDGGRHEVLRLRADGTLVGVWGAWGDPPDGLREPWDVAWHGGRLYVADMGNHRIARIDADDVRWRRP